VGAFIQFPALKMLAQDRSPALGDRSPDLQIFGRFLATAHDDVEAHLRAFCQARIAGLFHRRDMDKHVFAAAVRLNETITLRRIEPLHCPGRHFAPPLNEPSLSTASGSFAIKKPPWALGRPLRAGRPNFLLRPQPPGVARQPLLHALLHLFAASRHLSSFSCAANTGVGVGPYPTA
jgi:hypothetical protein